MFGKLLARLARHLDGARIPYMVIGGQAVLRYGEPRLTRDIDITLGTGVEDIRRVQVIVKAARLRNLVRAPVAFARKTSVLPVEDPESGIRVDLIFSDSAFERMAIGRADVVRIGNRRVRFASVEDVIIQKIIAGRPRDIEDVASVVAKQSHIDGRYIRKWLREFGMNLGIDFLGPFNRLREREKNKRKLSRRDAYVQS